MTIPTHILLGILIGSFSGNFVISVLVSVLVDIDHLVSYARHGVFDSFKKFSKVVTDQTDPYGDQRGYLHNVIVAGLLCLFCFQIAPALGVTFTAAYFGHLLLDALDTSDYWPLYPLKTINIRGFVQYYSKQELVLDILLLGGIVFMFLN